MPYALPIGMTSTLIGVLGLAFAPNYSFVLISVLFIGLDSAVIFTQKVQELPIWQLVHRRGLAQSIYQVGELRAGFSTTYHSFNPCTTWSNWCCLVYHRCSSRC